MDRKQEIEALIERLEPGRELLVPKEWLDLSGFRPSTGLGLPGSRGHFRRGDLHVHEYASFYGVHRDVVDPCRAPIAHFLLDGWNYLVARLCWAVFRLRRQTGVRR